VGHRLNSHTHAPPLPLGPPSRSSTTPDCLSQQAKGHCVRFVAVMTSGSRQATRWPVLLGGCSHGRAYGGMIGRLPMRRAPDQGAPMPTTRDSQLARHTMCGVRTAGHAAGASCRCSSCSRGSAHILQVACPPVRRARQHHFVQTARPAPLGPADLGLTQRASSQITAHSSQLTGCPAPTSRPA
jgi:hypothetical protein